MIPVGYMYKTISIKSDWLKTNQVLDIYSVSGCVSEDFSDWINYYIVSTLRVCEITHWSWDFSPISFN